MVQLNNDYTAYVLHFYLWLNELSSGFATNDRLRVPPAVCCCGVLAIFLQTHLQPQDNAVHPRGSTVDFACSVYFLPYLNISSTGGIRGAAAGASAHRGENLLVVHIIYNTVGNKRPPQLHDGRATMKELVLKPMWCGKPEKISKSRGLGSNWNNTIFGDREWQQLLWSIQNYVWYIRYRRHLSRQ